LIIAVLAIETLNLEQHTVWSVHQGTISWIQSLVPHLVLATHSLITQLENARHVLLVVKHANSIKSSIKVDKAIMKGDAYLVLLDIGVITLAKHACLTFLVQQPNTMIQTMNLALTV
jgi:hypothetical protein